MLRLFSFSLCAFLSLSPFAISATQAETSSPLKLLRMTPNGVDTAEKRQIVLTFNRPVVPLGDMTRKSEDIAVEIEPALNCQWRWLNRTALACQLMQEDQMQAATKYKVTLKKEFADHAGETLSEDVVHEFITTRPKLNYARITHWENPEKPQIQLRFNQYVTKESVAAYVTLNPVEDAHIEAALIQNVDVMADPDDRREPKWVMGQASSKTYQWADFIQIRKKGSVEKTEKHEARKIWIITPNKDLKPDTKYKLSIADGLVSAAGSEAGIAKANAMDFATFPAFKFLGVSCQDNANKQLVIDVAKMTEVTRKCNPMRSVSLRFSTPVKPSQVKKYMHFAPDLAGGRKDFDPWANIYETDHRRFHHQKGSIYYRWLPTGLQAAEDYHLTANMPEMVWVDQVKKWWDGSEPPVLTDVFGRPLAQEIDFKFATDHRPPNFEVLHNISVLEDKVPSDIPLYVTNLENAELSYRKMTADGKITIDTYEIPNITQAQDVQYAVPIGLRDVLDGQSGILYGHVKTAPFVDKYRSANRILNIITPFQIHAKIGHFNSQIWITDLTTGDVVPDAKVELYHSRLSDLEQIGDILDQGTTNAMGIVDAKGRIELDPELEMLNWCPDVADQDDCVRLFIRVTHQGRVAIMPLIYDFKLNTYRLSKYQVYPSQQKRYGHMHGWGMTAQGIYRRGDEMDFKIYLRDQDVNGYVPPMRDGYHIGLMDPMGNKVWEEENARLSEFGTFSASYQIPEQAPIGWYHLEINHEDFPNQQQMTIMRILVSDFTPSPFKVENRIDGQKFTEYADVTVESFAKLHSGGPYSQAGSRVQSWLEKRSFVSKHKEAKGFYFGDMGIQHQQLFQKQDKTDAKGEVTHQFALPETSILYGRLMVETAIRDDRGKYIASQTGATYFGRDHYVGLKQTKWLYEAGQKADVQYLVTDIEGTPVANYDVTMQFQYLEHKMAKVKGAGNAYLSKYTSTWVDIAECTGKTSDVAALCDFIPEKPGRYKAIAKITDQKGRPHQSESQLWVTGKGYVTWQQPNDHSLEIIPEQETYQIGDTARYLIKNPYPDTTAWVTIERYGILKSYSQKLEGSTPVISFEVTDDMVPGYYLSVSIMEPRIAGDIPEMGQVDMAKPVFKTGYIQQKVMDASKKLDVAIDLERENYKPGEVVTGQIKIQHQGKGLKETPLNLALVVLDESVLDLVQGREKHFDPYQGFYSLDALDVQNFNLLTRLVGLQKFEKKGANPGGDGGVDLQEMQMRNLFKYVAYWAPNLPVKPDGTASFTFALPDNLTGWRILAVAVDQDDLMGLGQSQFKTNKPTEIRPAMPNQVQEGDQFKAAFTVMNRSDKARDITVEIKASGDVATKVLETQTYHIAPYQRQKVMVDVEAATLPWQRDLKHGQIDFTVKAYDDLDTDMTMHALKTYKNRTTNVAAIYGTDMAGEDQVEDIAFPTEIYPDTGYLSVKFSPSVIGNIAGAFTYMRDYPYPCWEQKLSRAAMGGYYQKLHAYLPKDVVWDGAETLPQEILDQAQKYQAPNGGMVYFVAKNTYVSPYLSAYTALAFNWLREMGYTVPKDVEQKLHVYLKKYLRKAPEETYLGHASTIRAVILAALSKHEGVITENDLKRYAGSMPQMTLFGQAHYLQAALAFENGQDVASETLDNIMKYSHQSSGKFAFQEELDAGYENLLVSNMRANCAILSSMVGYDRLANDAKDASDIAMKLTRMITQTRGGRDHFENTQENIFCLRGLLDYAQKYEATKPNMTLATSLQLAQAETQIEMGEVVLSDLQEKPAALVENIGDAHIGQEAELNITSTGEGRYYYTAEMAYALKEEAQKRINAGMDIRKEYSVETQDGWKIVSEDQAIKMGDLVRVDLYLSLPTARHFVVVDDPVPGGVEPVNRDLATTSKIDADKGSFKAADGSYYYQHDDWQYGGYQSWHFYHQELRHDAARFYADYLPAGNYHLSYMVQAIAVGQFKKQPVKAAEMYDADIYGIGLSGQLAITENRDE